MSSKVILEQLSKDGFRQTEIRTLMVSLFNDSEKPISADEILLHLKKERLAPNKTTIYREIDFLLDQSIIRDVEFGDGKKRYELMSTVHHHHVVCTNCNTIQCVELEADVDELEQNILKKNHFKVTRHFLEFFGLCAKCR